MSRPNEKYYYILKDLYCLGWSRVGGWREIGTNWRVGANIVFCALP